MGERERKLGGLSCSWRIPAADLEAFLNVLAFHSILPVRWRICGGLCQRTNEQTPRQRDQRCQAKMSTNLFYTSVNVVLMLHNSAQCLFGLGLACCCGCFPLRFPPARVDLLETVSRCGRRQGVCECNVPWGSAVGSGSASPADAPA